MPVTGSFDFSSIYNSVAPLYQALAARYPELLNAKVEEAKLGPEMARGGYRNFMENEFQTRKLRKEEGERAKSADDAAKALRYREELYQRQHAGPSAETMNEIRDRNAAVQAAQSQAARYGAATSDFSGVIRDFYTYGPHALGGRGGGGGPTTGGEQAALQNKAFEEQRSQDWHAQLCRVNPRAPGCASG